MCGSEGSPVTQPDPQPGAAAGAEPTAATVVPPSADTTALVPLAESTETIPLPLSGSAARAPGADPGPYAAGPHPGAPYPAGPYPGALYPGPPYPPAQAAGPFPYSQYPTSAVPVSMKPGAYPYPISALRAKKGYGLLVGVATAVLVSRTHGGPLAAAGANPASPTPTPTPSRTPTPFHGDLRTVLLPVPAAATTPEELAESTCLAALAGATGGEHQLRHRHRRSRKRVEHPDR